MGRKRVCANPNKLVAKRLLEFFGEKKYSEIAKDSSVSDRTVSSYLSGSTLPNAEFLQWIAENGGDVNYILTGQRSSSSHECPFGSQSPEECAQMKKHMDAINQFLDLFDAAGGDEAAMRDLIKVIQGVRALQLRARQTGNKQAG